MNATTEKPNKKDREVGVPVYDDEHYLIFRKGQAPMKSDVPKIPFNIAFIGIGGINATTLVPIMGKDAFLAEVAGFEKSLRRILRDQKNIAKGLGDGERFHS